MGNACRTIRADQLHVGQQLDKQVYIGTAREDIAVGDIAVGDIAVGDFAFEIGYKQELESGMVIEASFLPTVVSGQTWSDPYALTPQAKDIKCSSINS